MNFFGRNTTYRSHLWIRSSCCALVLLFCSGCTSDDYLDSSHPETGIPISIHTSASSLRVGETNPNNNAEDNIISLVAKGAGNADNSWSFGSVTPGPLSVRINPGDITAVPGSEEDLYFTANVFGGSLGAIGTQMKNEILSGTLADMPELQLGSHPFVLPAYLGASTNSQADKYFLMTALLPKVSKRSNSGTTRILSNGVEVSSVAMQRTWNKVIVKLQAKAGNTKRYALRRIELSNVPNKFGLFNDIDQYPTAAQAADPYLSTAEYTASLNEALAINESDGSIHKNGVIANDLTETQERIFVVYLPPHRPKTDETQTALRLWLSEVNYTGGKFIPLSSSLTVPYYIPISSDKLVSGAPGRNIGRNNRITYTLTMSGWTPADINLSYTVEDWVSQEIPLPPFN